MRFHEIYEAVGYSNLELDEETLEKYRKPLEYYFGEKKEYIYRGMKPTSPLVYADGSLLERKSANTNNYYTLMMDFLPSWKGWPKRSKSFICTSNERGSRAYGELYFVVPLENQPIAVCSNNDFWQFVDFKSYGLSMYDLSDFNRSLRYLSNTIAIITKEKFPEPPESNPKEMKEWLSMLSDVIVTPYILEDIENSGINDDAAELGKFIKENKDAFQAFNKLFDPKANGCKLFRSFSQYQEPDGVREVWLSGKVLCVAEKQMDKVVKFLGRDLKDIYK